MGVASGAEGASVAVASGTFVSAAGAGVVSAGGCSSFGFGFGLLMIGLQVDSNVCIEIEKVMVTI